MMASHVEEMHSLPMANMSELQGHVAKGDVLKASKNLFVHI